MSAQCLGMRNFTELPSVPSDHPVLFTDQLRLAVAAYLARFKGASRYHTESDLRCYLAWCAERGLDPLTARRPHLELYIRWMQEFRRFKPSTVSRRFSVTAGFYRTCVINDLLEHSPAEHVRRPSVPPESPTLGFTHLQFEALLTTARQRSGGLSTGQSAPASAGRSCSTAAVPGWTATPPPAASDGSPRQRASGSPGRTLTCFGIRSSRPCWMLAWTCGMSRSPPGMPIRAPRCGTTGPARTSTVTRTTSSPLTWPPAPDGPLGYSTRCI